MCADSRTRVVLNAGGLCQPFPPSSGSSDTENSCAAGACCGGARPRADAGCERHEGTLVGNFASSWQTNGTVTSLAYANGAVYLAGDFTSVRPPGAASGTNEVARDHMAAFSSTTGALLPFSHNFAGVKPSALAAPPDGTRIYAGGAFLTVDGQARTRTIYVRGSFSTVNRQPRVRLGAVTDTGALVTGWNASADNTVTSVAVAPERAGSSSGATSRP